MRCASLLLDPASDARLRQLCASPTLAEYARGCLHNRDEVLRAHQASIPPSGASGAAGSHYYEDSMGT